MPDEPYALTARFSTPSGARVERTRFATLDEALAALEERAGRLAGESRRGAIDLKVRRFEPIHQVAARLEVRGPRRLAGGVDIRGDGSMEAFTGRLSRTVVQPRDADESAVAALGRALRG